MNFHDTRRLLKLFGSRLPTGAPLRVNRFSDGLARSRWYGSSRHQALASPQLSATIMSRVAPLNASATQEPLRQNACPGAPSLTPVQ